MTLIVFVISMFVSATLLFFVEPMMAKMALPLLGGSPSVWNTCLVFFQAVLLAGYLYGYAATKWLAGRTQIAVHVALVLTPFLVLPLHIPTGWEPPAQSSPVLSILGMLSIAVGLPFLMLSSSTPVLQRWFSRTDEKTASDPYFLYAASNVGSMVGLFGYPLLLEPTLRVSTQSHLWSYGYALFVVLTACCGVLVWKTRPHVSSAGHDEPGAPRDAEAGGMLRKRVRWVLLAFAPSSLMMGVTTALTTDIPAIPLFWVLPLALYLLSFVFVFARRPLISHDWIVRRLPYFILLSLFAFVSKLHLSLILLFALYLLTLFAVALVCHGELARTRPAVDRLPEFYLWISVGGVVGGIFNSLIAPLIFSTALEFPLVLIFAALLRPPIDQEIEDAENTGRAKRNDFLLPLGLGLCTAAVILGAQHAASVPSQALGVLVIVLFCGLMFWCLTFSKRPIRFGLAMAALMAAGSIWHGPDGQSLLVERNFFGVSRVTNSSNGKFRYLMHGGTLHGAQSLTIADSREPLSYYSRTGPAGSVLRALRAKIDSSVTEGDEKRNWAVVGLGAGALACYSVPGDSLTFYEIDPEMEQLALDTRYFTYLSQCAPRAQIVLGDARLKLQNAADGTYDLILIDAFSGDSIPMHLLTREALALYLRKLKPGGILAFHMSNHYLRLLPVFAGLAQDAGLVCLLDDDTVITQAQLDAGKTPSQWVVMGRSRADLGQVGTDPRWKPIAVDPGVRVWTDDYSNLLRIIRWD